MKKEFRKRLISSVLAGLMLVQTAPWTAVTAYAENDDTEIVEALKNESNTSGISAQRADYGLLLNGKSALNSAELNVSYGESLKCTLDGFDGRSVFYIFVNDKWQEINDYCNYEPGKYALSYGYYIEDEYIDGPEDVYSVTVTAAKLAAPENLRWDGDALKWDAPAATVDEGKITGDVIQKYLVTVYKNEKDVLHLEPSSTESLNFSNYVLAGKLNDGRYNFTVSAIVKESEQNHYLSSDASSLSPVLTVPRIVLRAGNGIEEVSVLNSTNDILFPGKTDEVMDIGAVLRENYEFTAWQGEGISFKNANECNTSITLDAGYSGELELVVTANASDIGAPAVSEPIYGGKGEIMASASDFEDGVAYYAFSKEADEKNVEWTAVENPAAGERSFNYQLNEGGRYYFYAKDAEGNTSRSVNYIEVTKIIFNNYYENSLSVEYADYLIGSSSIELPAPERGAWSFKGWFADSGFNSPVNEISTHQSENYQLYAKWEKLSLPELEVDGIERDYNGYASSLRVKNTDVKGILKYEWYKDDRLVSTNDSLDVKNVLDSGIYKVKISLVDGENSTIDEQTVENIIVNISKAALNVTVEADEICVGQDKPSFTLVYDELLGDDTAEAIKGTVSCTYIKGNDKGEYPIVLSDFEADNYAITTVNGVLKVNALSGFLSVSLENPTQEFIYNGEEHRPEVIVNFQNEPMSEDDYTVEYKNNILAGEAEITVTLRNNYRGKKTIKFEIQKAEFAPVVMLDGWKYGESANEASLSAYNKDNGEVTYYYGEKGSDSFSTTKPSKAGEYCVYATIPETANYKAVQTELKDFTIETRKITITAGSAEFVYDGLPHSDSAYEISGDGFYGSEGFFSVSVRGSVTEATPEDVEPNNFAEYKLNSITDEGNYTIECVPGTLRVSQSVLAVPFNPTWSDLKPGTANWVPVSRRNLTIAYELSLYAFDGETYEQVGESVTTADSSYSFAEGIRTHANEAAKAEKAYSYYYTIKAMPSGGSAKDNYKESTVSEYVGEIYTAKVKVFGDNSISSANIDGGTEKLLLNGESANVHAYVQDGYFFSNYEDAISADEGLNVSYENQYSRSFNGKLVVNITASSAEKLISFTAKDAAPVVYSPDWEYTDKSYGEIELTLHAVDPLGLVAWAVKPSEETPSEDEWTYLNEAATSLDESIVLTDEGYYYFYAKDVADNVARIYGVLIYKVNFKSGANDATGEMASILKVHNGKIQLPANTFSKPGYVFQNWRGESGIYGDEAEYSANPHPAKDVYSETLTAYWTQNQHNYKVRYFEMGLDGNYPTEPWTTKLFSAASGSEKRSDLPSLQLRREGFTLDSNKFQSITINDDNAVLDIYYSRNKYSLTYSYTEPNSDEPIERTIPDCYYGADLSELLGESSKPSFEGYTFIGWTFGDTGAKPDTMPAQNIRASGYFEAKDVSYSQRYYLKNLSDDGYTLVEERNADKNAIHGDEIYVDALNAAEIEGFSFRGANFSAVTRGEYPEDASAELTAQAKAGYYLNLYYDRKTYTASLNVWKGEVGKGVPVYTKSFEYLYGQAIPEGIELYEKDAWGVDEEEFRLVDENGWWSTGEKAITMPAGDITITQQYVPRTTGTYQLDVLIEDAQGNYSTVTFYYFGSVGSKVTVGDNENDTVRFNELAHGIDDFQYYDPMEKADTKLEGKITDTNSGEESLKLKLYLDRKPIKTTISYYYSDADGADKKLFATATKELKWGRSYNIEALAYFYGDERWVDAPLEKAIKANVADTSPIEYNFCEEKYVVSYQGYYVIGDGGNWPSMDYNTVDSLSEQKMQVMGQRENRVSIYYTLANPEIQYRVQVGYNPGTVQAGSPNAFVPLEYTHEGIKYEKVWIVNEAYLYTDAVFTTSDCEEYPGLAYYPSSKNNFGHFSYESFDTSFKMVDINGVTYYAKDNELYIPDTQNRFYAGHFTSYGLDVNLNTQPIVKPIYDYLIEHKATHEDNAYIQGADIYTHSFGTTIVNNTADQKLTVTYRNGDVYRLYHSVNNTRCTGHTYTAGGEVTTLDCDKDAFKQHPGYELVWYKDSALTQKASVPFNLGRSLTIYGNYEKQFITNTATAYFELADYVELDGEQGAYITERELEALAEDITETESSAFVEVPDDNGGSRQIELKRKEYYYNGSLVMIQQDVANLAFKDISIESILFGEHTGFSFDASNPKNILSGYCQAESISLKAYFVRDRYSLTVDIAVPNSNPETTEYRYGQTVEISEPMRDGYDFDAWSFTKLTESGEENWDNTETSFSMPQFSVKAEASWSAAEYKQKIVHYFQNTDLSFSKNAVNAMINASEYESITIEYNGSLYENGRLYENGVSFEENGKNYYFTDLPQVKAIFAPQKLAAIVETVDVMQEAFTQNGDYISEAENYNYAYTIYQKAENIETLIEKADTYQNQYGMQLEYYYALELFDVSAEQLVLGGTGTITLLGGGSYPYGTNASLSAGFPAGYDFLGWFETSSLPENVDDIDVESLEAIDHDEILTVPVTANCSYTAIILARAVDTPTLATTGVSSLRYGYTTSAELAVTVKASFDEGADPASYISAYQWYLDGKIVENAKGASFTIQEGWDAGEHKLECIVSIARKDNGVSTSITVEHTVQVEAISIGQYVLDRDHVADYDGTYEHSISVEISSSRLTEDDYTIYYSVDELNEGNYKSGSTENLRFKDVAIVGGVQSEYTVYYYVKSHNPNFTDYVNHASVCINPLPLTVTAGTASYSKRYDGNAEVLGSITDADSDLYKLAHDAGAYKIIGLLAEDELKGYVVNCSAVFNSAHVADASAVTLSNLKLADADGTTLTNYTFADSYRVNLSAYIEPLPLTLEWNADSFVYDGNEHCPGLKGDLPDTIPEKDAANLSYTISGEQTVVGDYNATVKLTSSDAETRVDDFSIPNATHPYSIERRAITVQMLGDTVTYNKALHGLSEYGLTEASDRLVDGHELYAEAETRYQDAGQYGIAPTSVKITDAEGIDMTDNYTVTKSDIGQLIINKKSVTVSGISAADKPYDGNAVAEVKLDGISFEGIEAGDVLGLQGVTASFESVNAGEQDVTIHIPDNALTGEAVKNYTLNIAESQVSTSAEITKLTIKVTAQELSLVYGEGEAPFSVSYTGLLQGEDESVIGGSVEEYTIAPVTNETDISYYSGQTDVGEYKIFPNISSLTADNYLFESESGILSVAQRELALIKGSEGIEKTYDGTKNVLDVPELGKHYVFTAVDGNANSGIVNDDMVDLKKPIAASYDSRDAGERSITLSALEVNNSNYVLSNKTLTIDGSITEKTLTVRVVNAETVYGEAAPSFSVKFSGFGEGDNESLVQGEESFSCEYDITSDDAGKYKTGEYTISVSGLTALNYVMDYVDGTLTVKPATITLQTKADKETITYGTDAMPTFSYEASGFRFGETEEAVITVHGDVEYNHPRLVESEIQTENDGRKRVVSSLPGTYTSTVVRKNGEEDVFTAENYVFVAEPVEITVVRVVLAIKGLAFDSKVYDGTMAVPADKINYTGVDPHGLLQLDKEYWGENLRDMFTLENLHYASADAGENIAVTFSIKYGEYLAARYIPTSEEQNSAEADITKRPLRISAVAEQIYYGDDFTPTRVSFETANAENTRGLVKGESATADTVSLNCAYSNEPDNRTAVGEYEADGEFGIKVADFSGSATAKLANYEPEYINAKLTVLDHSLKAPTAYWDGENPGLAKWNAVDGIGDVAVAGYNIKLMRGEEQVSDVIYIEADESLEYDFAELIHTKAGEYRLDVMAVASEENNSGKINVQDSAYKSGSVLSAPAVSLVFKDDKHSQAGGDLTSTTVNGEKSVVVIPGESGNELKAQLVNATGYTISDIIADSHAVITHKAEPDAARDGTEFKTSFALESDYSGGDALEVQIALAARPATVTAVVTASNGTGTKHNEVTYGYSLDSAVSFSVVADNQDDVKPFNGYSYEYNWQFKTAKIDKDVGTGTSWKIDKGLEANTTENYYVVRCVVKATRNDNGESTILSESYDNWAVDGNSVMNLIVNRAPFTANVTLRGWQYGETPNSPSLSDIPELAINNPSIAKVVYYYKGAEESDEQYTTVKPTDADDYVLYAHIPVSKNFNEYDTDPLPFTISKAKLEAPQNVTISGDEKAPNNTVSWDAVTAPKANGNGVAVGVKYRVELYKDDVSVKTFDDTSELYIKLTDELQETGEYTFKVTAISQDELNCDDSDESVALSVHNDVGIGELSVTKLYDGEAYTLTAECAAGEGNYQWYREGQPIDGATEKTLNLTACADSGRYTCTVTIGETVHYAPMATVTINKRHITLASQNDSKVYDGTALHKNDLVIGGDGFANGEGIKHTFLKSVVNVADTADENNSFKYEWNANTDSANYLVDSVSFGKLTIEPRSLKNNETDFAIEAIENKLYSGSAITPCPKIHDTGLESADNVLLTESDFSYTYADNTAAGTATVSFVGKGNYCDSISTDFIITRRSIVIAGVEHTESYTGAIFSFNDVKVEGDKLANGHTHNVTASVSGTDASDEAYVGTITAAENVRIKSGNTDVTANYIIETRPAKLWINKSNAEWTVSLEDFNTTYNGLEQSHGGQVSDTTASPNATSYSYAFADSEEFTPELASLKKQDAGEYEIIIRATNPNYEKAADASTHLNIAKAKLEVITGSDSRAYNGEALKAGFIDVKNLQNNETIGKETIGSQLNKGTSQNDYKLSFTEDDAQYTAKKTNYTIDKVTLGELSVTALPVKVTINGKHEAPTYNGEEQTVEGYDWSADSPLFNDESFFSFNASASASQKNVGGKVYMNLREEDFSGINPNFDVSFAVNDGYIEVQPIKGVVVTITGNSSEGEYNGTAYTASGYNWSADNALYESEGGVTHNGTASVSRTDKGKSYMELNADDFGNSNTNFAELSFNIIDGYVDVKAVETLVVVTITGHNTSGTYNGKPLSVEGFDWQTDNAIFKREFFSFSGTDKATQTNAGISYMGLVDKFALTSENFTNVRFDVSDGWAKVEPKAVQITLKPAYKVFGKADPEFGGTVSGLIEGESIIGLSYIRSNTAEVVGTYKNALTASYGENPNYAITVIPADFVIHSSTDMRVSGEDYSAPYDTGIHGAAASSNIEDAVISYSVDDGITWSADFPTIQNVGKLEVTVKASHHDYVEAVSHYTLEVTPAAVSVMVDDGSKIYGDGDPELTAVITGLYNDDEIDCTIEREAGENVGHYIITASGESLQGNYAVTYVGGDFSIEPKSVELAWSQDSFVYDTTEKQIRAEIVNKVTWLDVTDDVAIEGYNNAEAINAGSYKAEALTLSGAQAENYTLISGKGLTHEWMIDKAAQLIAVEDYTTTYNGKLHSIEAELTVGDGELTAKDNEQSEAGRYTVTFEAAETANYYKALVSAVLTIQPKSAESETDKNQSADGITISELEDVVYTGESFTPKLTITDALESTARAKQMLHEGKDYTLAYEDNIDAGTASVTVSFIGNYSGTVIRHFNILPCPVKLSWTNSALSYNGGMQAITATVSNAVEGDEVALEYKSNQAMNAGSYKAEAIKLVGADAENYTLEEGEGLDCTWSIARAQITLTAEDVKSTVGEALKELIYVISEGELYGSDVLGDISVTTTADKTAGTFPIQISIADGSENPNYIITLVDGVYTLEEAVIMPDEELGENEGHENSGTACYLHWLIVLLDAVYIALMLFTAKRKEYADEAELKKARKKARSIKLVALGVFAILLVLINIWGKCALELVFTLISMVIIPVLMYFVHRYQFKTTE